jgi:hypothetical protein
MMIPYHAVGVSVVVVAVVVVAAVEVVVVVVEDESCGPVYDVVFVRGV